MKEYLFSYRFNGKRWTTSVFADSEQEAKLKIQAQAAARYDGVLYARVPIPLTQKGWQRLQQGWQWLMGGKYNEKI